jgi:hypothetical protein
VDCVGWSLPPVKEMSFQELFHDNSKYFQGLFHQINCLTMLLLTKGWNKIRNIQGRKEGLDLLCNRENFQVPCKNSRFSGAFPHLLQKSKISKLFEVFQEGRNPD